MRTLGMIAAALLAPACIEGEDPNACGADVDCGAGRVCNIFRRCEAPERLGDVRVDWTINDDAPNATTCADLHHMSVGVEAAGWGTSDSVMCEAGSVLLARVPLEFDLVHAWMYMRAGAPGDYVLWRHDEAGRDQLVDGVVTLAFGR